MGFSRSGHRVLSRDCKAGCCLNQSSTTSAATPTARTAPIGAGSHEAGTRRNKTKTTAGGPKSPVLLRGSRLPEPEDVSADHHIVLPGAFTQRAGRVRDAPLPWERSPHRSSGPSLSMIRSDSLRRRGFDRAEHERRGIHGGKHLKDSEREELTPERHPPTGGGRAPHELGLLVTHPNGPGHVAAGTDMAAPRGTPGEPRCPGRAGHPRVGTKPSAHQAREAEGGNCRRRRLSGDQAKNDPATIPPAEGHQDGDVAGRVQRNTGSEQAFCRSHTDRATRPTRYDAEADHRDRRQRRGQVHGARTNTAQTAADGRLERRQYRPGLKSWNSREETSPCTRKRTRGATPSTMLCTTRKLDDSEPDYYETEYLVFGGKPASH